MAMTIYLHTMNAALIIFDSIADSWTKYVNGKKEWPTNKLKVLLMYCRTMAQPPVTTGTMTFNKS